MKITNDIRDRLFDVYGPARESDLASDLVDEIRQRAIEVLDDVNLTIRGT